MVDVKVEINEYAAFPTMVYKFKANLGVQELPSSNTPRKRPTSVSIYIASAIQNKGFKISPIITFNSKTAMTKNPIITKF